MIRLDNVNIEQTIENAHDYALKSTCERVKEDFCYTEQQLRRHYRWDFITSFLDAVIDDDIPEVLGGWSLEETLTHLDRSGIPYQRNDEYDCRSIVINIYNDYFYLERYDDDKYMMFQCCEYLLGEWNQSIVDLFHILTKELNPSVIHDRSINCIKQYNHEMTQRHLIEATGIGIIHHAFNDMGYTVLASRGYEDLFKGTIETDWGRVHIESTLQDLPEQIDRILQEKENFNRMLVTLEEIEGIE